MTVVSHSWLWFFGLMFCSLYLPDLLLLAQSYHFALVLTGNLFSTFSPVILRKILNKIDSEEAISNLRYDEILSSSPSSHETVSMESSDDDNEISLSSSHETVYIESSDDDDDEIPLSFSQSTLYIDSSDDDDNGISLSSLHENASFELNFDKNVAHCEEREKALNTSIGVVAV